ncbi:MAG: methyltransferase family protein [Limisphaerales bacterium]
MKRSHALLCNGMRIVCFRGFIAAVRQIGFTRVSGINSLLGDTGSAEREPEAQGPALDSTITGPFRFSRHPLNFLAIPLIWLAPRMTRNRLAFNCAASLYFVVGSLHEEKRMREAWGILYDEYRSRTHFMLGVKPRRLAP